MSLATSVLAALHYRRRSGEGQFIDYSQCEGVSSLLGEVLLGYEMNGEIPERQGNRHRVYAPHNVYRAWGADRWIALEVHNDTEFEALAEVLGQAELAGDERFSSVGARKANEEELDSIVEAWSRQRDRDWIVETLNAAGVAAAPSRDGRDLYADRHLRERGAFVTVDHPELGELELVAVPWRINGERPEQGPAPLLGEHNEEILGALLEMATSEIEALREKDVIQ